MGKSWISSRSAGSSSTAYLAVAAAVAATTLFQGVHAATFQLVQNHSGQNFLNNWNFYTGIDVNDTGNVYFQTQQQAVQQRLVYLNSAGNYIIKVDNTTSGAGNSTFGRPSVYLRSAYTIQSGNLVLMDAHHLPYGCSVWPAFWTQGPNWPNDGEIDIIEGVNQQTLNSISLHTLSGCTHPNASQSSTLETGTLVSTDCFNQTNFNQGCVVTVPGNSYGASFAQNDGGVYALNWNGTGMYMWFFPRGSIPADLPTSTPNPDGWGLPTAFYPSSMCNFQQFFSPQTIILDITICGNFAGQPNVFTQTCSGTCLDLVPVPSNYNNAFFEIGYIRVFRATNGTVTTSGGPSVASATGTATGSSSGKSSAVATIPSVPSFIAALLGMMLGAVYLFN